MVFRRSGKYFFLMFGLVPVVFFESLQAAEQTSQRGVEPVPVSRDHVYEDSWAIIIGINRYRVAPRLNYAVSDARSVLAALNKHGFSADKTIILLDGEATRQRIEEVLYGRLQRTKPDDRVFVFFAGHGITVPLPRGGEEGYILPVDGDPDNPALTAISMEDLRRISRWVPAKHILFTVDACYSGFAITRDVPPRKVDMYYLEAMAKEPAVQIITAGRKGEPVLEEQGHGLFTRRMIHGLSGLADTDQNGVITGQELATWLESRVIRDSRNRQHPQYARLSGEGQFLFVVPRGRDKGDDLAVQKLEDERKRIQREAERIRWEKKILEEQRRLQAEREQLLAEKLRLEDEKRKAEAARRELERLRLGAEKGHGSQESAGISETATAPAVIDKTRPKEQGHDPAIQRLLNAARNYRDNGEYQRARAELRKAKTLAPGSKVIEQEINKTEKACRAEQQLGQPVVCF